MLRKPAGGSDEEDRPAAKMAGKRGAKKTASDGEEEAEWS